jgi:hypothetical protein
MKRMRKEGKREKSEGTGGTVRIMSKNMPKNAGRKSRKEYISVRIENFSKMVENRDQSPIRY